MTDEEIRSKFLNDLNELLDGFTYGEDIEFSVGTPTLSKVRQIREAYRGLRERADAAEADLAKLKHIDKSEMLRLLRIAEDKIRDLESALRDLTAIQQDRIAELETLYMQAVAGRKTFRQKYRELRDRIRELETDGRRLNWLLDQEIGYHGRSDIDAAIAAEEGEETSE